MGVRILTGDCRDLLADMEAESVHCVVTSPPYWGLRDYEMDGQIGLEGTVEGYVAELVDVFRGVRRVLRPDGTVWLNLGDAYAGAGPSGTGGLQTDADKKKPKRSTVDGLASKNLIGVPWRAAFGLQADGWILRSAIIWHKPAPMPESVKDRPTVAHEYVFLFAAERHYFYDAAAIRTFPELGEKTVAAAGRYTRRSNHDSGIEAWHQRHNGQDAAEVGGNARTVWSINTPSFRGSHFATMPVELADRCIRAGSPEGGLVLDPFGGAGTTAVAADRLGRDCVLCELNPDYAQLAARRVEDENPMFAKVVLV